VNNLAKTLLSINDLLIELRKLPLVGFRVSEVFIAK
jgi:hypothetical protein